MIDKLFFSLLSGILAIFIAVRYIPDVNFSGTLSELLLAGIFIGMANFFVKPFLKVISLPLRILTFGLFSLVINIGLVLLVIKFFFKESFEVAGIIPFIFITFLIWFLNFIFSFKKLWKT